MYATVFKKDPLDPALGMKYRECILKPGGSREETESLKVRLPPSTFALRILLGCSDAKHRFYRIVGSFLIVIYVGIPWEATKLGGVHEGDVRDGGFDC